LHKEGIADPADAGGPLGRTDTRGFSVIELLAVMILLGLLAIMAIGKYNSVREQGYLGTLKADLKNLSTHQEMYYQGIGAFQYSNNLATLEFQQTPGVIISIPEATTTGWSAVATHQASTWSCALFIGDATAVAPATKEGFIECARP
jgi:prepilin-type N-terminal cleavage/methylation domain-containing protein